MLNNNDLNEGAVGGADVVPALEYEYKTPFFADGLNSYWLREISQITLEVMKLAEKIQLPTEAIKNPIEIQASFIGDNLVIAGNEHGEMIAPALLRIFDKDKSEILKNELNRQAEENANVVFNKEAMKNDRENHNQKVRDEIDRLPPETQEIKIKNKIKQLNKKYEVDILIDEYKEKVIAKYRAGNENSYQKYLENERGKVEDVFEKINNLIDITSEDNKKLYVERAVNEIKRSPFILEKNKDELIKATKNNAEIFVKAIENIKNGTLVNIVIPWAEIDNKTNNVTIKYEDFESNGEVKFVNNNLEALIIEHSGNRNVPGKVVHAELTISAYLAYISKINEQISKFVYTDGTKPPCDSCTRAYKAAKQGGIFSKDFFKARRETFSVGAAFAGFQFVPDSMIKEVKNYLQRSISEEQSATSSKVNPRKFKAQVSLIDDSFSNFNTTEIIREKADLLKKAGKCANQSELLVERSKILKNQITKLTKSDSKNATLMELYKKLEPEIENNIILNKKRMTLISELYKNEIEYSDVNNKAIQDIIKNQEEHPNKKKEIEKEIHELELAIKENIKENLARDGHGLGERLFENDKAAVRLEPADAPGKKPMKNHDHQIIVPLGKSPEELSASSALHNKHPGQSTYTNVDMSATFSAEGSPGAFDQEELKKQLGEGGRLRLTLVGHGEINELGNRTFGGKTLFTLTAVLDDILAQLPKDGTIKSLTVNLVGCDLAAFSPGDINSFSEVMAKRLPQVLYDARFTVWPDQLELHARETPVSVKGAGQKVPTDGTYAALAEVQNEVSSIRYKYDHESKEMKIHEFSLEEIIAFQKKLAVLRANSPSASEEFRNALGTLEDQTKTMLTTAIDEQIPLPAKHRDPLLQQVIETGEFHALGEAAWAEITQKLPAAPEGSHYRVVENSYKKATGEIEFALYPDEPAHPGSREPEPVKVKTGPRHEQFMSKLKQMGESYQHFAERINAKIAPGEAFEHTGTMNFAFIIQAAVETDWNNWGELSTLNKAGSIVGIAQMANGTLGDLVKLGGHVEELIKGPSEAMKSMSMLAKGSVVLDLAANGFFLGKGIYDWSQARTGYQRNVAIVDTVMSGANLTMSIAGLALAGTAPWFAAAAGPLIGIGFLTHALMEANEKTHAGMALLENIKFAVSSDTQPDEEARDFNGENAKPPAPGQQLIVKEGVARIKDYAAVKEVDFNQGKITYGNMFVPSINRETPGWGGHPIVEGPELNVYDVYLKGGNRTFDAFKGNDKENTQTFVLPSVLNGKVTGRFSGMAAWGTTLHSDALRDIESHYGRKTFRQWEKAGLTIEFYTSQMFVPMQTDFIVRLDKQIKQIVVLEINNIVKYVDNNPIYLSPEVTGANLGQLTYELFGASEGNYTVVLPDQYERSLWIRPSAENDEHWSFQLDDKASVSRPDAAEAALVKRLSTLSSNPTQLFIGNQTIHYDYQKPKNMHLRFKLPGVEGVSFNLTAVKFATNDTQTQFEVNLALSDIKSLADDFSKIKAFVNANLSDATKFANSRFIKLYSAINQWDIVGLVDLDTGKWQAVEAGKYEWYNLYSNEHPTGIKLDYGLASVAHDDTELVTQIKDYNYWDRDNTRFYGTPSYQIRQGKLVNGILEVPAQDLFTQFMARNGMDLYHLKGITEDTVFMITTYPDDQNKDRPVGRFMVNAENRSINVTQLHWKSQRAELEYNRAASGGSAILSVQLPADKKVFDLSALNIDSTHIHSLDSLTIIVDKGTDTLTLDDALIDKLQPGQVNIIPTSSTQPLEVMMTGYRLDYRISTDGADLKLINKNKMGNNNESNDSKRNNSEIVLSNVLGKGVISKPLIKFADSKEPMNIAEFIQSALKDDSSNVMQDDDIRYITSLTTQLGSEFANRRAQLYFQSSTGNYKVFKVCPYSVGSRVNELEIITVDNKITESFFRGVEPTEFSLVEKSNSTIINKWAAISSGTISVYDSNSHKKVISADPVLTSMPYQHPAVNVDTFTQSISSYREDAPGIMPDRPYDTSPKPDFSSLSPSQ